MSRGSISSWQDYGRRNSHGMPQFSGSPAQFMTSDDMECKRGDGWFLSYPKIAAIVTVFIIGVIAAGVLGWYIHSLPKKKAYDSIALLNDEIEDSDIVGTISTSPFIHPLKYRLELEPVIDVNGASKLKGRVVIEFQVNGTSSLSKLSLNAKNITVTSYKLSLLDQEEDKTRFKKRRIRRAEDETNHEIHEGGATLVTSTVYSVAGDSTMLSLTEDQAILYQKIMQYPLGDAPFTKDSEAPTEIHDSLSDNGKSKVKGPNASDTERSLTSSSRIIKLNSTEIEITQYKVDEEKGIHVLYLGTHIEQGTYSLELDYETPINDNAFYVANFSKFDGEKWLMGTKLEPFGARRLLPVFDDVSLKSVFSVSVARPKEMRVLSNMPLRTSRDTSNNAMIVDTFDVTPPFSPHNLAFLMGHIESIGETLVGNSKITATFWGDSGRRPQGIYLLDKLSPAVINLIDMFSMPYPLPKLDLVGLPPGIDENMGNPGLISMKQSLFYATNQSSMVMKNKALKTLVNLLGHQWLGGFVDMNWSDTWILEGSLLCFQHEIVQQIDPSLLFSNSFINDVQLYAMEIDGYSISRSLQENINHHRLHSLNDQYTKGACLIRMLHGAINDTTFRNGYKKFIRRWKYGTADAAEFFSTMSEEANGLPTGVSLENMMNSWISQSGYPVVTVSRDYKKGSAIIRQEHFTYDKPSDKSAKLWYIPLSYTNKNGNWSSPNVTWFKSDTDMTLDDIGSNDSWVLFNVNKTGYYRVNYDHKNWMLLKIALLKNHELFPPETRASLIDDVFSLAAVGLTKYETAFDFIKYMQMKERHYAPWGALMRHVFKLNRLLYETAAFTDFQEFMLEFVSPLYKEVGSDIKQGSRLTLIAVKMACAFEHTECLNWSKNTFENAKTDADIRKIIPPYVRKTFYCTLARYGDNTRKEWNYFLEKAISIEDKEEKKVLLSSFACFQAPWILQTILNDILHEDTFHRDEISVILSDFPKNPAAAQAASRFVRANWHDIVRRFPGSYSILKSFVLSMVNGLTTEQDLEDLQAFIENNYDSMKGARYAAAIVEANGKFVTSWLNNSLPDVENLLNKDTAVKVPV